MARFSAAVSTLPACFFWMSNLLGAHVESHIAVRAQRLREANYNLHNQANLSFLIYIMCFLPNPLSYSSMFFVTLQLEYHNSNRFMTETKKIRTALVSVFHKDGLNELLAKLNDEGVRFLSTGGTRQFIEELGYECGAVEDVTAYPSILGGRVKTLHPKVFGGILARRDNPEDQNQMKQYHIEPIDLVVVDLYPFEETVATGASQADIIEKIDIGGISLIRAGAKNFNDVVIVPSKNEYGMLLDILNANGANTTLEQRRAFATRAFGVSSHYDKAIHAWFEGSEG